MAHSGTARHDRRMGLSYSFEAITSADAVTPLLEALARQLEDRNAARVREQLPWRPAVERQLVWGSGRPERERQGIGGIRLADHERPNDLCLSFRFAAADAELERYARENHALRSGADVVVGCVSTRLFVGEELALLTATAVTSDMSRLFAASTRVREAWAQLGRESGALAVFLDTELDDALSCVWPEPGQVPRVSIDGYWSGDFASLRVDPYLFERLRLARLLDR